MNRFLATAISTLQGKFASSGWLVVPAALLIVVILFLAPVPAAVLDILLVVNLVVSVAVLLRAVLARDVSQLYAFPVLLLLTTLYRLSLNITSTRLILLRGEQGVDVAGHVIEAFGKFVVGGDFVVGAVVFIIIAVVNFLVITRGAARVAEVSARFSLDSLPGRQLAVDTDLRNGVLTSTEAGRLRTELMRESQFFGSMDGAMRFVQGDAIATLVILFVNVVGGVFLGVSRGLDFSTSLKNFGVLAVGDGLISILPALLISLSAGIVVTHTAGKDSVGELVGKLFDDRRLFLLPGILLLVIGALPGFPLIPFFLLGGTLLFFAFRATHDGDTVESKLRSLSTPLSPKARAQVEKSLTDTSAGVSPLTVTVNPQSAQLLLIGKEGETVIGEYIRESARVSAELGIPLPDLRLVLSSDAVAAEYEIRVRGTLARRGKLPPNKFFAPLSQQVLTGFGAKEVQLQGNPIRAGRGAWAASDPLVESGLRELGVEVSPPHRFVALECVGAAIEMIDELYGIDELKGQIGRIREEHPALTAEVLDRGLISVPELLSLLHELIRERVSIRDLKLIFEGIAQERESDDRSEFLHRALAAVRRSLARQIVSGALCPNGTLRAFTLAPDVEDEFRAAVSIWDGYPLPPPLPVEFSAGLSASVSRMFEPVIERGALPVVFLVSEEIRTGVSGFFRHHDFGANWFVTLSFEECGSRFRPETVGVLGVDL